MNIWSLPFISAAVHQYTSPVHEPAIPAPIPSTIEVRLKKVDRPKPAPPPAAENTMENELLKKLKRRQQTIEVAELESSSPERTAAESTPPPPTQPAPPSPPTQPAPPPPAQLETAVAESEMEKTPPPVSECDLPFFLGIADQAIFFTVSKMAYSVGVLLYCQLFIVASAEGWHCASLEGLTEQCTK